MIFVSETSETTEPCTGLARGKGLRRAWRELTVGAGRPKDNIVARVGDLAEKNHHEGGRDDPVRVAGVEELAAARDGGPALARKHCEVRHGGEPADVGREVRVPERNGFLISTRSLRPSNNSACGTPRGPSLQQRRPGPHFLVSPPEIPLARNTQVDAARMMKVTVRAPTPVEPTWGERTRQPASQAHRCRAEFHPQVRPLIPHHENHELLRFQAAAGTNERVQGAPAQSCAAQRFRQAPG
jgi:hypothetical protein